MEIISDDNLAPFPCKIHLVIYLYILTEANALPTEVQTIEKTVKLKSKEVHKD